MRSPWSTSLPALLLTASAVLHAAAQAPRADSNATNASAPLPEAPSASTAGPTATAERSQDIHLPASFRPAWAVERPLLGQKIRYGAASLVSVRNLVEAVAIAGFPSVTTPPSQPVFTPGEDSTYYQTLMDIYGDQTNAWLRVTDTTMRQHAYRLEIGLATVETRQLLSSLVLPIALHQDARYRPAPIDSTLGERMVNAAKSIVLTEDDHGRVVPNYSKLGGTIAAGFAGSMLYAPMVASDPKKDGTASLNSGRFALQYTAYSLAGDLATNATRELLRAAVEPDMEMYELHGPSTEDSYYPRSVGGKIMDWAHSTYSLRTFVSSLLLAGLPSIKKEPTEPRPNQPSTYGDYPDYSTAYDAWGQAELQWKDDLQTNVRSHARRLAGGLAETETQVLIEKLIVPVGLGIDARYIPLGPGHDAGSRLGHACSGLWQARTDEGGRTVNLPVLAGTVGAAFVAKELYYPQLGTPALETNAVLVETIGMNLVFDLIGNVHAEFRRRHGYF